MGKETKTLREKLITWIGREVLISQMAAHNEWVRLVDVGEDYIQVSRVIEKEDCDSIIPFAALTGVSHEMER